MNSLQKTLPLLGACALLLVSAPMTQAASSPRNTANWIQENASRIANQQVRVQVAMVQSLGESPDGQQHSFLATTWARGESGGTIIVLVQAQRADAFEKKFGSALERDDKDAVKTTRLDAMARINPATSEVVLVAN